ACTPHSRYYRTDCNQCPGLRDHGLERRFSNSADNRPDNPMGSAIRPLDLERRLVAAVHLHVSSQRTDPSGAEYVVPVEPGTAGRIPIWALDVSGNLSCYGYWRRSLQP